MSLKTDFEEIARIGYTPGGYEVYIVTDDEGNIPHFHYRKGSKDNCEFHTCIRFDCAKYFHHTGKEDVLSNNQIKDLLIFLEAVPLKARGFASNWHFAKDLWNANNNIEVDLNLPIPDYINLK